MTLIVPKIDSEISSKIFLNIGHKIVLEIVPKIVPHNFPQNSLVFFFQNSFFQNFFRFWPVRPFKLPSFVIYWHSAFIR